MEIINSGFSGKDYFERLFEEVDKGYDELTRFSHDEKIEYKKMLDDLKYINKHRDEYKTKEIGDALENLVNFIFEKSSVFTIKKNIRTSSNEVDQLIVLNNKGKYFKNKGYLNIRGDYIISECKNYNSNIGVTWVGKFFSLLSYTNTKVGILFSYNGLTGSGWDDAVGLTKKLFMLKEKAEDKIYIIDVNINHYERMLAGESFLRILEEQILGLSTDTNTSLFVEPHENQKELKKYINTI